MNDRYSQQNGASTQTGWDTESQFDLAIKKAKQQLERISRDLEKTSCPQVKSLKIMLNELSKDYIEKAIADCEFGPVKGASADYVYIIRVDDKNVSVSLCDQMRADAKRRKIDRMAVGYSRINVQNLPSQTLYVGRSRDMGTRVRQHLGADLFKPYALHFELWAKNNAIEVTIDYMRFEDRDDLLVQAIEDGLWESLKPAFGRKGSR